jgi:hypothetical protein
LSASADKFASLPSAINIHTARYLFGTGGYENACRARERGQVWVLYSLLISANDDPPPTFKKEVKPRRCCLIFARVVAGSAIEPYSDVVFAAVAKSTIRGTSMSQRKEITGRDGYIIVEALTFAVEALSKLPIEHRPDSNIDDMKRLIEAAIKQDATLGQLQKIAQRRLAALLAHVGGQGRP